MVAITYFMYVFRKKKKIIYAKVTKLFISPSIRNIGWKR